MFTKEKKFDYKIVFDKILRKIRKNPQEGLKKFHEIFGKLIFRTALKVCRRDDVANEVFDDVMVKIWNLAYKNVDIKNPCGFIYIITENRAKDYFKTKNFVPLNDDISVGEDNIQQVLEQDAFNRLISCLDEYEQSIVIRKVSAEETFKEIAQDDDKPLTTISSIYYRCLEKIQKSLLKNKKN